MKRIIKVLAFSALLLASACSLFGSKGTPGAPLGIVKKGDVVQRITLSGTVIGARRIMITAPFHGVVKKLHVDLGARVKEGQPLVTIVTSLASDEPAFPIRAPFAGIVTQMQLLEGDFVREGESEKFILRVDDVSKLFVRSKVPELDVARMRTDQTAAIRIAALGNTTFSGVVREIALAAEESKDNVFGGKGQVEFVTLTELKAPSDALRPGMSATIDIIVDERKNVLTLPLEYVSMKDGKYSVKMSTSEMKNVTVGLRNDQVFEITGGLSEGVQVQLVDAE
jgi:multidrug efflux pump subunit AcrA (membrane-fusion protein)